MTTPEPPPIEPPFVGAARKALVEGLVAVFDRVNTGGGPAWISLEAPSGWGKTRVVREFYARLAAERQGAIAYWPPAIIDADDDAMAEIGARRKRLRPAVTHVPGSLPTFAWWGITCAMRNGTPSVALSQDVAQLEAHAPYLDDAWAKLPKTTNLLQDLRSFGLAAADEATMEVAGSVVELALGTAVPMLGLVRWVGQWSWTKVRERSERRERTGSSDAVADDFGDLVSALVTMLARLSRPGLPTVIVIEDLHDADPMLAELLTTLVASSAAVMIVSTGWPGHLSESPALTDAMAAAGGRLVRISSDAAAPPPAPFPPDSGLGRMPDDARASIVRFYYPAVEDQTLAMLVDRYANPLVLELFCQLPVYRRKYADGALKLTAADVAALPATVRELYRQLWSELPESVRHALTIATLGIPSVIDPKGGRSADWNQSLMLEIIEAIGLPNGEEVERSLDEAPTVYAWARTVTETLRRFAEHDQLAVASDDQRDFLDEGDIRDIKNALAARLATRLLDDPGSRSSEEIEHSARLVLALHAEDFIDDGEVVAAATLALIRILADLPRERAELIRIAERALRESDPRTPNGRAIRLELMIALRLTGRPDRAVELARELDGELTAAANADPAEVRAVRMQLCASLGDAGHNAEALELAGSLVEANTAALGPHHSDTFKARNLLVIETSVVDSAESAIPLQESLVADMAAVLAVGDRLRIRGDANLASYYSRADRPHDALRLQSAACAAAVEHLGPVDEDTMIWKQGLSGYLADAGQLVAATAMRRELLADISATLGDDHPAARDALSSLSLALGQAAQRDESIALAREFVARTSSAYGERTRRTLDALSTLAGLQRDAADYEGAIATATRARSIAMGLADSTFTDIVPHESLIALAVGEMQSPEAAVALLEPLLQRAQQELGPTHFLTLGLMNNMGHFYGRAGRPEDAIAVLHELVTLRRELPSEARNLSDDVVQLAYLYRSIRLADSSVNFLVPLIETMTDRFGATSVPAVNLRIELIDSLIADNRAAEARALAETLVVELDQVYPRWHALVFSARTSLAVSIEATGEVEEAMLAYRSLVDEAEGHLGVTDPMTLGSIDMLLKFADQPNGFSTRVIADIEGFIDPIRAALAPSVRFSHWLVRAVSIAVRADRYDLALEWGTECIAGLRELRDADPVIEASTDRLLAEALRDVAYAQIMLDDDDVSVESLVEAIVLYERSIGRNEYRTIGAYSLLGFVLGGQGRFEESAARHLVAAQLHAETYGDDDADSFASRHAAAAALAAGGFTAEAIAVFEQVLADRETHLGVDHPATEESRAALAELRD